MSDSARTTKRLLEALSVHSRQQIPASALHGLKYSESWERDAVAMVRGLDAYIWTEKIQDETVELKVSVPATWWQAFKQEVAYPRLMMFRIGLWHPFLRFTMNRLLPRWPVRMREVTTSHQFRTVAKLPEFRYEPPHGCGKVVLETMVDKLGDSRWNT